MFLSHYYGSYVPLHLLIGVLFLSHYYSSYVPLHLLTGVLFLSHYYSSYILLVLIFLFLLGFLRPQIYSPGDYVITYGDIGDEMYFLARGSVQVINVEGKVWSIISYLFIY